MGAAHADHDNHLQDPEAGRHDHPGRIRVRYPEFAPDKGTDMGHTPQHEDPAPFLRRTAPLPDHPVDQVNLLQNVIIYRLHVPSKELCRGLYKTKYFLSIKKPPQITEAVF